MVSSVPTIFLPGHQTIGALIMAQFRVPGPSFPLAAGYRFFADSFQTPIQWHQRYGNLVNINAARGGAVVAFGPENNRQIFTNTKDFYTIDADSFPFKLPPNTALHRLWNNGLLQMNGERHNQQRRLMMPALHKKQIDHYRGLIIVEAEKRLGEWRSGETRDVLKEMRDLTTSIAMRAFLGMSPDAEGAQLHRTFYRWTKMIQSPLYLALPINVPGLPFRRLLKLSAEVEQALAGMLAQKSAGLPDAATQDGLSVLIYAHDEDGTRLTDNGIIWPIGTVYIAGH